MKNMDQGLLFDWDTHAQPAIDRAESNADDDWKMAAARCIHEIARELDTFTSDHVILRLRSETVKTHNLMALGALFQKAAKQGLIINSGSTKQTILKIRHRKLTVWKSLIRKPCFQ